jgi:hypothetical protein
MQDREVVAAIVAGDPDGFAEAYDQHAASLYAYCHLMLPDAEDAAADAVRDTFLIAACRLEGLGDPDKLRAWLHAVARNECLRRLGAAGVASRPAQVLESVPPTIELPAGLRGQVLTACADNTPAGRADRASVAHRAGTFGPTGFPKTAGSRWWERARLHPRATAAVTALAAAAVAAGITAMLTAGGPHHVHASVLSLRDGQAASSPDATASSASAAPSRQGSPASGSPTPSVAPSMTPSMTAAAAVPSPKPSVSRGTPSASASASSSPSPSSSPSSSAAQGILEAAPNTLMLKSASGKAARGQVILFTEGGPVSAFTIKVPAAMAGKVEVSPVKGAIAANGFVTVTVTVTSAVAVSTHLTVEPGNIIVTVRYTIKA